MSPLEKLENAVEEFVAAQSGEFEQHTVTGFVLSYESLDMAAPDTKRFRSSYAVGGPSNTPAQSIGLLVFSHKQIEQDVFDD